jgi:hypothetical protein
MITILILIGFSAGIIVGIQIGAAIAEKPPNVVHNHNHFEQPRLNQKEQDEADWWKDGGSK